jgi:hypothetical protein
MKHICSACGLEFGTEAGYLEHQCSKANNARPTEPNFLRLTTTPNLDVISQKAVERGAEK